MIAEPIVGYSEETKRDISQICFYVLRVPALTFVNSAILITMNSLNSSAGIVISLGHEVVVVAAIWKVSLRFINTKIQQSKMSTLFLMGRSKIQTTLDKRFIITSNQYFMMPLQDMC